VNPDDLTPLVKRGADDFERALLRAGQREHAPEGTDRRVLEALGLGATGGSAAASAKSAHLGWVTPKGMMLSALLVVGATGIGRWAVLGSYSGSAQAPTTVEASYVAPSVEPSSAASPASPTAQSAISSTMTAEPLHDEPAMRVEDLPSSAASTNAKANAPSSERAREPARFAGDGHASPGTKATGESLGTPSLAREIELLAGARDALAKGDEANALGKLDVHDREFPNGALAPESRVLRIETLARSSDEAHVTRARDLADAFLASHPSGPQARRVRALIDRLRP
jgi:hypothetical protein